MTNRRGIVFDRSKRIELAVSAAALGTLAVVAWLTPGVVPLGFYYAYIGVSVLIGLILYFSLRGLDQPLRRRLVLLLLGTSLFGAAALRDPVAGLFQIEGLFFDLFSGVLFVAVIHYIVAKLVGPVLFGRVWCGWACWTATLLDQLPFKRSPGRLAGPWGALRYAHLGASFLLVALLWYGFHYRPGNGGATAITWFIAGNALYYLLAVGIAVVLKDNRAFCKYLCPVAVPLKLSARHALLRVQGDPTRCCSRRICEKVCPMDIRIADYLASGERVLSTECILCQACLDVCPDQVLTLSFGRDQGAAERLQTRDQ
jgi:ferredoxin-type protein NapH